MKHDPAEYGGSFATKPYRASQRFPIIVHSHLGWDWVWQRPQQFISRLSRQHRVLFVEAPYAAEEEEARIVLRDAPGYRNITILQTYFPAPWISRVDWLDRQRERTLRKVLSGPLAKEFDRPLLWFYDPMAVRAYLGKLDEVAVVYDCMDQLSQFRGAPPGLVERERELLERADLVFAGGPKIHRAKLPYNANCHSYGCGVDVAHFSRARDRQMTLPPEIAALEGPVLGFFGVVDERMDYQLIAALADADPYWNIVIVGPHTKVDESELPRRHNIHWLGGRAYCDLPAYASRFDVCLMPFALNEATEYINPTKALEYMATGKPIVSTAVEDVVDQFSEVIDIVETPEQFITACRRAVSSPDQEAIERGLTLAGQHSWEAIVGRLQGHMSELFTGESQRAAF